MHDKVIARCLSDMASDETCANKQRAFIFALHQLFFFFFFFTISHTTAPPTVNTRHYVMEVESLEKELMDNAIGEKELINKYWEIF
jgi:hypothetical protein